MFTDFVPQIANEEKQSSRKLVTLGIELEVPIKEVYRLNFLDVRYRDDINQYYTDIYTNFIDPLNPEFFRYVHDGGLEIISQPFTFKWYQANKEIFNKMLNILLEKGFRDNADHSGMHVHINKEAFTTIERNCLFNFMDKNSKEILLFSDRCAGNYANQGIFKSSSTSEGNANSSVQTNRKGIPTKEFRLFSSTLQHEKFCSNIEFVHSLYAYVTKTPKNTAGTKLMYTDFGNYVSFVLSKALSYKNLVKTFIKFGFVDDNIRRVKRIKKAITLFEEDIAQ